jgi:hypothetical protein
MEAPEKKQDSEKVLLSCLTISQIWLITLMDGGQSTYLTKLEEGEKKKNPVNWLGSYIKYVHIFPFYHDETCGNWKSVEKY